MRGARAPVISNRHRHSHKMAPPRNSPGNSNTATSTVTLPMAMLRLRPARASWVNTCFQAPWNPHQVHSDQATKPKPMPPARRFRYIRAMQVHQ